MSPIKEENEFEVKEVAPVVKKKELSRKSRLYNMNFFRYIPKEGFRKTLKYNFSKTKVGKSRSLKRK